MQNSIKEEDTEGKTKEGLEKLQKVEGELSENQKEGEMKEERVKNLAQIQKKAKESEEEELISKILKIPELRLIIIEENAERKTYFIKEIRELPKSLKQLNEAEDIYVENGKNVTFQYEIYENGKCKLVPIRTYQDYKNGLKTVTAQGLLVFPILEEASSCRCHICQLTNEEKKDQKPGWKCCECHRQNEGEGTVCSYCIVGKRRFKKGHRRILY